MGSKGCPFCGHTPVDIYQPGAITFLLCSGCGAMTSFRARASAEESYTLYQARNDPTIRPGYIEAMRRFLN